MRTLTLASFALALLATGLSAQETLRLDTKGAWEAMQKELSEARQVRNHARYRSLQQSKPGEFLEAWDKTGAKAEGEQLYYLGMFYGMAARHLDAIDAHRTCAKNEELPGALREQARGGFAGSVYAAVKAHDLEAEAALKAVAEIESFAEAAEKPETQGAMLQRAAYCLSALGNHDAAIEMFIGAARANPALAYGAGRNAMGELMGGTWEMAAYDGLRNRGKAIIRELTALQQKYIVELEAKGDEKTLARAESSLKRLAGMTKPLEMLGEPAPAWTLVKAYGDTKAIEDHRGKVVMLDFWATWCGWCIKSFPAIRDVLADYEGKDFRIVGVTAPANSVTESRYALDDDLKAKGDGQSPAEYHRFPAKGTPEEQAKFRAEEQEILAKFIANHEMTWDVVMIDATEPGSKYALTGWPHAMVLDKLGRVRYFKRGALLKDRPEAIAKLKRVVDSLLAEER